MGGIVIENNKALCMLSGAYQHTYVDGRTQARVDRFFIPPWLAFTGYRQPSCNVVRTESDAYPADAEDGYGWEKFFGERLCRVQSEGLRRRDARGPLSHLMALRLGWRRWLSSPGNTKSKFG